MDVSPAAPPSGHAESEARRKRRPKRLRLFGALALCAAALSAAQGVWSRQEHESRLAEETEAAAIPVVTVVTPQKSAGGTKLSLPGDVQAFYEAPLYARVNGYLKAWNFDIGARVKKGDVLATIETPELDEQLDQAKGELAMASANLALAETTSRRWHALLASNSVSQQSADEKAGNEQAQRAVVAAQKAHVQSLMALESFKRLVAPFDGVVTARNTDIGALINQGSSAAAPLFKVADLHEMRVYVRVPQTYSSQLQIGMDATLTEPQYAGRTFPAKLQTTSNAVAAESRTLLAELMAPNADGKLWPGAYAQVSFHLPGDPNILQLPASAMVFQENGAQVAVLDQNNRIHLQNVSLGRNLGAKIEILSGISPNDRVVDNPADILREGETVHVADNVAAP